MRKMQCFNNLPSNDLCNDLNTDLVLKVGPYYGGSLQQCDFISYQCQGQRSTFILLHALHRKKRKKKTAKSYILFALSFRLI